MAIAEFAFLGGVVNLYSLTSPQKMLLTKHCVFQGEPNFTTEILWKPGPLLLVNEDFSYVTIFLHGTYTVSTNFLRLREVVATFYGGVMEFQARVSQF